jgi:uncharacterized pyridoxamine 5'-phosphate oxidase family protein
MKEVLDFLKKNNTFYVATVDGDKPAIRPFGAVTEINGKLYIVTNNKKDVYKQMKKPGCGNLLYVSRWNVAAPDSRC